MKYAALTFYLIFSNYSFAQLCTNAKVSDRIILIGDSHFTGKSSGESFVDYLGEVKKSFGVSRVDRYAVWGASSCDWNSNDLTTLRTDSSHVGHNFFSCPPDNKETKGPVEASFPTISELLKPTPKAFIVELGTNDIRRICLLENADEKFKCITDLAGKISQATSCIWIGPPAYAQLEQCNGFRYNQIVDGLASKVRNAGCKFIDFRQLRDDCAEFKSPRRSELHFAPEQYNSVGKCLADLVNKQIKQRPQPETKAYSR
jgi:hypothetical protein